MKDFETPVVEIIYIAESDIITDSSSVSKDDYSCDENELEMDIAD